MNNMMTMSLGQAMDVGRVLTDTGKALVDLFDEDKDD